ncbi:glycosyltransferase family 2 protein [Photobacterium piscicola]|uniref:glycosyltransferase family 2 protein n=1 Tax=Photobacterium piscicola TaxID=1378299 RepID=UPI002E18C835|nr:glycosyltransferase family 2 protein [Photobacterium piscicola]
MQNKENDLISIIMPSYNSEKTILNSIYSVLSQTYKNWELIICDDGSNDQSVHKISEICDSRIKLYSNENKKGAAGARNTALKYANGKYICFLDSDDLWDNSKLDIQLSFMKRTDTDFSYSSYKIFKGSIDNIIGEFNPPDEISYYDLLKWCDIGCLTVMVKRELIIGLYFPYCYKEDYAFWLIILKKIKIKARNVPNCISYYRISSNSLSSNKIKEISRQYNVLINYSDSKKITALYYTFRYILNGLKKHLFRYRGI